jgi:SAM-dependent methyltransferase
MPVSYDVVRNFPGWLCAQNYFQSLIAEHGGKRLLEVGAGANPTLTPEFVQTRGLTYVISDANEEELRKAKAGFDHIILNLSQKSLEPRFLESFDFVFSRMVAEHVSNGDQYHRNIYKILRPGGISAHCFSTLWALPLVANRLLPERLGSILQNIFSPRDEHLHGKFKAYYSWSRGPTSSMLRRFQKIGFEVIDYTGFFGHNYYVKLPWLNQLETWKSQMLVRHPIPQLCAYATFVLRKPG